MIPRCICHDNFAHPASPRLQAYELEILPRLRQLPHVILHNNADIIEPHLRHPELLPVAMISPARTSQQIWIGVEVSDIHTHFCSHQPKSSPRCFSSFGHLSLPLSLRWGRSYHTSLWLPHSQAAYHFLHLIPSSGESASFSTFFRCSPFVPRKAWETPLPFLQGNCQHQLSFDEIAIPRLGAAVKWEFTHEPEVLGKSHVQTWLGAVVWVELICHTETVESWLKYKEFFSF